MKYVMFSWDNPLLIKDIKFFLRHLPQASHDQSCVVVNGMCGVLDFASDGYNVLDVDQLTVCQEDIDYIRKHFITEQLNDVSRLHRELNTHTVQPKKLYRVSDDYFVNLSIYYLAKYLHLIQVTQPDCVFVWNGFNPVQRALSAVADQRSIPCFYLERGLLPDTLFIDRIGINYASHVGGEKWKSVKPLPLSNEEETQIDSELDELNKSKKTIVKTGEDLSKATIYNRFSIPKNSRVILLALQVERDSNIVLFSPFYKKMIDVVIDVKNALSDMNDVFLIVKLHPEEAGQFDKLKDGSDTKTALTSDISLHCLLDISDVVVCINSTVGLEALTQKKQVVVLGNAIYSHKGFTHDLKSKPELKNHLQNALESKSLNKKRLYTFLKHIKRNCLFSLTEKDAWKSRQNIIDIINHEITEKKSSVPNPKIDQLQTIVERNKKFHKVLSNKPMILVHSSKNFSFLNQYACRIVYARNKKLLFKEILKLFSYDIIIIDGKMGFFLKFIKLLSRGLFISKDI